MDIVACTEINTSEATLNPVEFERPLEVLQENPAYFCLKKASLIASLGQNQQQSKSLFGFCFW